MRSFVRNKLLYIASLFILTFALNSESKTNFEQQQLLAIDLYNKGKFIQSEKLLSNIITSNANANIKTDAHYYLGLNFAKTNNFPNARQNFEYYIENSSKNSIYYPNAILQNALVYYREKKYEDAITRLCDYIKAYPKNKNLPTAYYHVAQSLFNLSLYDESISYFKYFIEKYPYSQNIEIATTKLKLMETQKSELVLQNTLKWSHEQHIETLKQLKQDEAKLKDQLFSQNKKNNALENEILELKSTILEKEQVIESILENDISLKKQISSLIENQNKLNTELEVAKKELSKTDEREKLLLQKEEVLKIWENRLKNGSKR